MDILPVCVCVWRTDPLLPRSHRAAIYGFQPWKSQKDMSSHSQWYQVQNTNSAYLLYMCMFVSYLPPSPTACREHISQERIPSAYMNTVSKLKLPSWRWILTLFAMCLTLLFLVLIFCLCWAHGILLNYPQSYRYSTTFLPCLFPSWQQSLAFSSAWRGKKWVWLYSWRLAWGRLNKNKKDGFSTQGIFNTLLLSYVGDMRVCKG